MADEMDRTREGRRAAERWMTFRMRRRSGRRERRDPIRLAAEGIVAGFCRERRPFSR